MCRGVGKRLHTLLSHPTLGDPLRVLAEEIAVLFVNYCEEMIAKEAASATVPADLDYPFPFMHCCNQRFEFCEYSQLQVWSHPLTSHLLCNGPSCLRMESFFLR